MDKISNICPKTKQKLGTVLPSWENGLPSTQSMMYRAQFGRVLSEWFAIVGGEGEAAICERPLHPPRHGVGCMPLKVTEAYRNLCPRHSKGDR